MLETSGQVILQGTLNLRNWFNSLLTLDWILFSILSIYFSFLCVRVCVCVVSVVWGSFLPSWYGYVF